MNTHTVILSETKNLGEGVGKTLYASISFAVLRLTITQWHVRQTNV